MRALLISANTETINMPALPMGLGCVAEALKDAGHAVRFLDLMGIEDWRYRSREHAGRMTARGHWDFHPQHR